MHSNLVSDPSVAFDVAAPRRVVSLVPSVTASLYDLGLSEKVVGVSDFCLLPENATSILRVGGVKDPDIETIQALKPDLIIANREENGREAIEALAEAGILVWLTFPLTVRAAVDDLWKIANIFRSDQAIRQVDLLEKEITWAEMAAAEIPPRRYFCPIWQEEANSGVTWWMTFNEQTYPHDVLRIFHGENIFAKRSRRYPLAADLGQVDEEPPDGRDTRYPRMTREEILAGQPEIILLPSEPYLYDEAQAEAIQQVFADTPAVQAGRVYRIDGTLIHWHGTRLARALVELPPLFLY